MRANMGGYFKQRRDLAAAFRWAARLNFHEAVANHFSFAVNDDGTRFIMNPNQRHFSRIKASDIIEIDANDPVISVWPKLIKLKGIALLIRPMSANGRHC